MKTCCQCNAGFEIAARQTALREKISANFEAGPVPPPTLCPDCRMQRRQAWRNETNLYHRKCSKTGKDMISVYPADAPFPVYDRHLWWSDAWDALDYGMDFDFSRPFFEQFAELLARVPRAALNANNTENSDYCNFAFNTRNCYLSHDSYHSEGLFYCYWLYHCKDSVDCSFCFESERCFECTDCNQSYNCRFCVLSNTCRDSAYLYDCRGCSNCFGCVGLRNKEYHMFNEPLKKEEYERRLKEFDLQNPRHVAAVTKHLQDLKLKHPHRYSVQEQTENCTGDYIFQSKDCDHCFQLYNGRDCMYVQEADVKDCLDGYHPGWSDVQYEVYSTVRQHASAFVAQCWDGSDNFYCDNCQSCSHCFGCIGLQHKQYCILNKQYSKDDYVALLPRIVEHMRVIGEWGEFFPVTLSPFAYNETMANVYFPLSRDEVLRRGWRYRDELPFTHGLETISWDQIPERIEDVSDSITKEVLDCRDCGKNYKIIPQELRFYREMHIALPRQCPPCRNQRRLCQRNPYKLYDRVCSQCQKPIRTTYAPERPETVVCEECYLKTIY